MWQSASCFQTISFIVFVMDAIISCEFRQNSDEHLTESDQNQEDKLQIKYYLHVGFKPLLIFTKCLGLLPLTFNTHDLDKAIIDREDSSNTYKHKWTTLLSKSYRHLLNYFHVDLGQKYGSVFTKCLEMLPLNIHTMLGQKDSNNIYVHKWTSPISIYSLFMFITYIINCIIFIPYMWHVAELHNNNCSVPESPDQLLPLILETAFFGSHEITALLTYLFVQVYSNSFATILNQLSHHVSYFAIEIGPEFGKPTFRKTNWFLVGWSTLLLFIAIYIVYFKVKELNYFDEWWLLSNKLIVYPLVFLSILQALAHFFPTYLFVRWIEILGDCFIELGNISLRRVEDVDSFLELYAKFLELESLGGILSNTFGIHFILEIITLVTTTVVHMYFTAFHHQGYHSGYLQYVLPPSVVIGYAGWLITAGNYGNSYKRKIESCMGKMLKSIKNNEHINNNNGTVGVSNPFNDLRIIGPLVKLSLDPVGLHFCYYIDLDRTLLTTILSVLAAYFVILIQFNEQVV